MRSYLRGTGLAAAAVLWLAAGGSANAALNYTGQTATTVSVAYSSLPASTQIAFVDRISGSIFLPSATVSGSGTLVISLAALPPGEYYLLAHEAGDWVAQTVWFYF
ncbi:MAG TPA: hypothetical protein VH249_21380 [Xanthobacteraceae bacterium]|nr:hypothetical protein [Xanthobacteraceae bacterium]